MSRGLLHLVGTGPGGPDHLTLGGRAALVGAREIWAIAGADGRSRALEAVRAHLPPGVPLRTFPLAMRGDDGTKEAVYAAVARVAGEAVAAGHEVALLCLGDPLLYGTASRVLAALDPALPVRVHPGISSLQLAAARVPLPLAAGEELLALAPATADPARIEALLDAVDVLVLLKVGSRLPDWHRRLAARGLLTRSWLARELDGPGETVARLDCLAPAPQPYMSLLLIRTRP